MPARRPAGVNSSAKALQRLAKECGLSPLCKPCGWPGKKVPAAWKRQLPGTPYDAEEPLRGLRATLRGDSAPSVVVGPATPMGPGLLQRGRVSTRYECQGSVMVRTPLGLEVPVPRSVVRERARLAKPARATCRCAGLPYPHRVASSPLCELSPRNAPALRDLARDAYEEGDDDRASELEGRASALERLQMDVFRDAEARAAKGRADYRKRLTAARRDARREGWDV